MTKMKFGRWRRRETGKRGAAIAVVATVAIGGGILLVAVHAATGASSVQTESGTVTGAASIVADTSASGSQAVKFGSSSTGGASRSLNCVPAVADTMTNTVSHLCGFPDTTNTGPLNHCSSYTQIPSSATSGTGWSYNSQYGELDITGDNVTLNCIQYAGSVDVYGKNDVIQNSIIHEEGDWWAIGLYHSVNTTIKNTTIYSNSLDGPNRLSVAVKDIYGDTSGSQVLNNNIYHTGTMVQIANGVVSGNYMHDFGFNDGDHINGVTVGGGDLTNMLIQNNTILNQRNQTDCVALFQDFGNEANKTITGNLFAGAGYSVYGGGGSKGTPYNITITNNHFSRLFYSTGGSYGPVAAWISSGSGNVFSGNIWDDTGATVTAAD